MVHDKTQPSMDVLLNGKRIALAGICGDGSVHTEVDIHNMRASHGCPIRHTSLSVGGLFDQDYHWWHHPSTRNLGDEIVIRLVAAESIDTPTSSETIGTLRREAGRPWWKFWGESSSTIGTEQRDHLHSYYQEYFASMEHCEGLALVHDTRQPCMEVLVNGTRVAVAGVCGDGFVGASVTITNIRRNDGSLLQDTTIHVGGLFDDVHHDWYSQSGLQVGDEIVIRLIAAESIDTPKSSLRPHERFRSPPRKPWWQFWRSVG